MANNYDKILKENIASVFLPLSEKYLGLRIIKSEELKDKVQTTIEKEPDFIRIVETDKREKFILHLEFQSMDEEGMIYRMQEYYGILSKKYQLPVRQFVIYLGQKASRMKTKLTPDEIFEGFTLRSLRDYSYQHLLSSQVPEEIILAVLADFEGKKPTEVLRSIINKLQEISKEEITLKKYIRQLSVLARLRNLSHQTKKQIEQMALSYNIKEDAFYQEGQKETKKQIIARMLKDKTLTIEKIAEIVDVSIDYVRQIAKELKK